MASHRAGISPSGTVPPRAVQAGLRVAALAAVAACVVLLGVRTLTTPDLGFHLGFGERLLDTGRMVDHIPRLYTLPATDLPADLRPEPGPGNWYDAQGRYRFPNANWLSQGMMAASYRLGGMPGLSLLRLGLVVTIGVGIAATLWRLGVPAAVGTGAVLLAFLIAYPRFVLRPELFGYVALVGQMAILAGVFRRGAMTGPTGLQAAGLLVLQALFASLHSYFLLGLALTGTIVADGLVRWLWTRRSPRFDEEVRKRASRSAAGLSGLLLAQILVCFLNPWTWRIVVLPFQTLAYMRVHRLAAGPGAHPWSHIRELAHSSLRLMGSGPWTLSRAGSWAGLIVGLAGCAAAARRRRWALLLAIAGMMMVGASTNRNLAAAAVIAVPLSVGACTELARPWVEGGSSRSRAWLTGSLCALWIALSASIAVALMTHRFYYRQNQAARLGWGLSRTFLPVGVVEWLNEHPVRGRVWVSFTGSSTLYGFVRWRPGLPILTNTWAYPASVMAEIQRAARSAEAFERMAEEYGVTAAVVRRDEIPGMFANWERAGRWAPVVFKGQYALFIRTEGPDAELARSHAWRRSSFDVSAFLNEAAKWDAVPAHGLHAAGAGLLALGWPAEAAEALRRALALEPASRDIRSLLATAEDLAGAPEPR